MIPFDLTQIRALAFDVDGVLSANNVFLLGGQPVRTANIKDGYALQHAAKTDLHLAIITGGKNEAVRERYMNLGITDVFMGVGRKIDVFEDWLLKHQLSADQVRGLCGCPCCPADAAPEIQEIACYISHQKGGEGCVRDVVEQVLRAQGKWMSDAEAFGW